VSDRVRELQAELADAAVNYERVCSEHDTLRAKYEALQRAATAMVEKIDAIHASPDYQAVWILAANLGMPYRGPDYSGELQALRAALSGGGV
jgi:hypothetical protein